MTSVMWICSVKSDGSLVMIWQSESIRMVPGLSPRLFAFWKRMEPFHPQYAEGFLKSNEKYSFRKVREATGVPVCICEQFNGFIENDVSRGTFSRL